MSELPYLLTAVPSGCSRGTSPLIGIDPMPTPPTAKLTGAPELNVARIVNRGLEKNRDGNPPVRVALGVGETASQAMLRELEHRVSSIDPDTAIGTLGENDQTAHEMLENLKRTCRG